MRPVRHLDLPFRGIYAPCVQCLLLMSSSGCIWQLLGATFLMQTKLSQKINKVLETRFRWPDGEFLVRTRVLILIQSGHIILS